MVAFILPMISETKNQTEVHLLPLWGYISYWDGRQILSLFVLQHVLGGFQKCLLQTEHIQIYL